MSVWKTPIPFNYGTIVFVLLMSFVLSVPVSVFPNRFLIVETPEYLYPIYRNAVLFSWILLPFWSVAVGEYRALMAIGQITFFLGVLWNLLFPAVSVGW